MTSTASKRKRHNSNLETDSNEEQNLPQVCDQCRMRKIHCDRQRPACGNCRRAGVRCDFEHVLKRVNHSKKLHEDFGSVVERLDKIDETLARLTSHIFQHQASQHSSPLPVALLTENETSTFQMKIPESNLPQSRNHPTARNLLFSIRDQISQLATSPSTRLKVKNQLQYFPFQESTCHDPIIKADHREISSPPRFLVGPAVKFFLENYNTHLQIFEGKTIQDAVDYHYAGNSEDDDRISRCAVFNCMVLLSLATENLLVAGEGILESGDMVSLFLNNCNRALARLDQLTRPCVLDIQVLIMLALVGRECYGCNVLEHICQLASQMAQSAEFTASNHPQKQNMLWTLYTMDKQTAFMNSQPRNLYLLNEVNIDLQLPLSPKDTSFQQKFSAAHVHLMIIWEKIFLALYSPQNSTSNIGNTAQQISDLRGVLNEWTMKHYSMISPMASHYDPQNTSLQAELRYCYHTTHILIARCSSETNYKTIVLSHARDALTVLTSLSKSQPQTTNRLLTLGRMVRNYPIVAFHELLRDCLGDGRERGEDLELLRGMRAGVERIQTGLFPDAYYTRLLLGMKWCLDVLDVVVEGARVQGKENALLEPRFSEMSQNSLGVGV